MTVAVSVGGIWQTVDGGTSWRLTADGYKADYLPPTIPISRTRIVWSPVRPIRLVCGRSIIAAIWRSDDTGETWQAVTAEAPSRFGFAVAVHPRARQTA